MRTKEFHEWLAKTSELSPSQRQQAVKHLTQPREPSAVIGAIVGPNPPCPHCHHTLCTNWGNAHGLPRYRCDACGKTFNALTGKPLAHLRRRESWPEPVLSLVEAYAQAMIAGETVRAAARRCSVDTCAEPVEARAPHSAGVTVS